MKEVTLHQQEQARLHVLNSVVAEEITAGQAAALMDLSERHARDAASPLSGTFTSVSVPSGICGVRADGSLVCTE